MKENFYDAELRQLGVTLGMAVKADIGGLKVAIAAASESSLFGVGSGGSYTTAALLCSLHEAYTGRVSRPSTPLELICNPTLASSSPVFLVSAEGKNPDIIEAVYRARQHSARTVHVLTNKQESPLTKKIDELTNVNVHCFPIEKKDGYLATNSMLMNAILVARSYSELEDESFSVPGSISDLQLKGSTIDDWIGQADEFVAKAVTRSGVIVVYSPQLQAIATDLESKLSESAITYCQLADIRSFAHGRHLWCSRRPDDCAILAITEPTLDGLWQHMAGLIPKEIPILEMSLRGSRPWDLITGLVAQMHLVSRFASHMSLDPGKPKVEQFGRELYYSDLSEKIPSFVNIKKTEQSKLEVIGCKWPSKPSSGGLRRKEKDFLRGVEQSSFKAAVFDYDGTLCSSQRKNEPPSEEILKKMIWLAERGILVGVASGRGRTIKEYFENLIPKNLWSNFVMGLYNSGAIVELGVDVERGKNVSEFLSHSSRIIRELKSYGVPIEKIKETQPFQLSVRFREGISTSDMWFVLADAHRQAGLDVSRLVCSKHSIDVLGEGVGKYQLLSYIIHKRRINPYKIITFGDQGAWPGNDAALLEHRYSLSVDIPSRRMDRGWKLSPMHKRDIDATIWYLDKATITDSGELRFSFGNE